MTATIHYLTPPKGYSMWGSVGVDGGPVWYVALADSFDVVHEQWEFGTRGEAEAFLASKRGGAHAGLPPQCA